MDLKSRIPQSQVWEVLGALFLILWRIWMMPDSFWRDWAALLGLYWGFLIFCTNPRWRSTGTIAWIAGLTILYGWGRLPLLLAEFRISG